MTEVSDSQGLNAALGVVVDTPTCGHCRSISSLPVWDDEHQVLVGGAFLIRKPISARPRHFLRRTKMIEYLSK